MKKKRFSPDQISKVLQAYDNGQEVSSIVRDYGVSRASFYKWRSKYQGMDTQSLKRLKQLEQENQNLKHMYAELALDLKVAKEILGKKL